MMRRTVCALLVDDDADILSATQELLEYEGHRVATAKNGEDALAQLEEVSPQMILLDLAMPKMDGVAFREAQRRNPVLASIPTVIMTAADRMLEKTSSLEPADCIAKPFSIERLVSVVARYCTAGHKGRG